MENETIMVAYQACPGTEEHQNVLEAVTIIGNIKFLQICANPGHYQTNYVILMVLFYI